MRAIHRIPVRDAELACTVRGDGPPRLVFSMMGTRVWERLLPPPWDRKHTPICVALRGSGASSGDPAVLDVVQQAIGSSDRTLVGGMAVELLRALRHAFPLGALVGLVGVLATAGAGLAITAGDATSASLVAAVGTAVLVLLTVAWAARTSLDPRPLQDLRNP